MKEPVLCPVCGSLDVSAQGHCTHCGSPVNTCSYKEDVNHA